MLNVTTLNHGTLPLLVFQAQAPVSEKLEYKTDIMMSHNGSEKRVQLRSKPRQSFQYKIPTQLVQGSELLNAGAFALRKVWAIPIWTDGQHVGKIFSGVSEIFCDTENHDLRENSMVLIYQDNKRWQLVEVLTNEPGKLTLSTLTATDGIEDAWLYPVRKAYITNNMDRTTNGYNAFYTIAFDVIDNPLYTGDAAEQYDGRDIYYQEGLLQGNSISRRISQNIELADFEIGKIHKRTTWSNSRYAYSHKTISVNAEEAMTQRKLFARRAGKLRSFWSPTFDMSFMIRTKGNLTTFIDIDYDAYVAIGKRKKIAIKKMDGTWIIRNITSVTAATLDSMRLNLDITIGIHSNDVYYASWMGLNRLDSDTLEIEWLGNGISESTMRIIEILPNE